MKQLISLVVICAAANILSAQEVVSPTGNYYENNDVNISWTIGEPVIETTSSTDVILTQGFHQVEMRITAIEDFDKDIEVNVFPNPVSTFFNVDFIKSQPNLTITLYDLSGKTVQQIETDSNTSYRFDASTMTSGTYSLTIVNKELKKVKTFKIIKTS